MGTSALKTVSITNLDAQPILRANSWVHGGPPKDYIGNLLTVSADSTTSTYRFFRIGSWMRCASLVLSSAAMGASSSINVGLWRTAADGGAVVDADFFASAVDMSAAIVATDITFEAANAASNMGLSTSDLRIWEVMGQASDPNLEYDVVAQPSHIITTGARVVLRGRFVW